MYFVSKPRTHPRTRSQPRCYRQRTLRVYPENSFGISELVYKKGIFLVCGRLGFPESSRKHCEYSKYIFYIVEVYTKALKKIRVKNMFSSWRKRARKTGSICFFFKKSKISKFSDFWKIENVKIKIFNRCQDFFDIFKIPIFENHRFSILIFFEILVFWKSNFSKMKQYFSLSFFVLPWYILLLIENIFRVVTMFPDDSEYPSRPQQKNPLFVH